MQKVKKGGRDRRTFDAAMGRTSAGQPTPGSVGALDRCEGEGGDAPSVIIGPGRIGGLLFDLGCPGDLLLAAGERLPQPLHPLADTRQDITGIGDKHGHKAAQGFENGPIYVTLRLFNLEEIFAVVPPKRRDDLVFIQVCN